MLAISSRPFRYLTETSVACITKAWRREQPSDVNSPRNKSDGKMFPEWALVGFASQPFVAYFSPYISTGLKKHTIV